LTYSADSSNLPATVRTTRRLVSLVMIVLLAGIVVSPLNAAADVNYIYDALGRLVAVVDSASNEVAIYAYDSVGNLLSITRQSGSDVAIIQFSPLKGPVGTSVRIEGTGFSTTPTSNAVTFNGTVAEVTSSTSTEIVAIVSAGAVTGAISVTTPGGSATSATDFMVTGSAAPTITSFTPEIGAPGTAVTITGTNFEEIPTANRAVFNTDVALAPVTSATSTSLQSVVPGGVGSGRISVATPEGQAVSSGDFFVPPAPYTAADVAVTGRMAIGGSPLTATVDAATRIGLVAFDGTAGQEMSLGVTTNVTSNYISINKPDGSPLLPPSLVTSGAWGGAFDLAPLPRTGTYTIVVDPYSAYTGNATLTLSEDLVGTLTVNGGPLPLTFRSGQNGRFTFAGSEGQRLGLLMSGITIAQSAVSIQRPDGTLLTTPLTVWSSGGPPAIDTAPLPATGTYTVVVDPAYGYSGNLTLTLSEELGGTITLDGPSVTASIGSPGQRARYAFDGAAGQWASIAVTSVTVGAGCCSLKVFVLNPDGTTLTSAFFGVAGTTLTFPALPATGSYAILVDPEGANTGDATLTLSAAITGGVTVDGPSGPLTISRVGQNARFTFSGTAGQHVKVTTANVTMVQVYVSVLKPDGTNLLAPALTFDGTTTRDLGTLPATGTYTVVIDPYQFRTGSMDLTVFSVTP
jgi:YD repeat-containing protein